MATVGSMAQTLSARNFWKSRATAASAPAGTSCASRTDFQVRRVPENCGVPDNSEQYVVELRSVGIGHVSTGYAVKRGIDVPALLTERLRARVGDSRRELAVTLAVVFGVGQ